MSGINISDVKLSDDRLRILAPRKSKETREGDMVTSLLIDHARLNEYDLSSYEKLCSDLGLDHKQLIVDFDYHQELSGEPYQSSVNGPFVTSGNRSAYCDRLNKLSILTATIDNIATAVQSNPRKKITRKGSKRRHGRGPATVTTAMQQEIIRLRKAGLTYQEIGKQYGVSYQAIQGQYNRAIACLERNLRNIKSVATAQSLPEGNRGEVNLADLEDMQYDE